MIKVKTLLLLLTIILFFSCEENEDSPRVYMWTSSDAIPYFDAVHKLKIADGTSLYISGMVNGIPGIFKLDGNTWTKVIETYGFADDFSVYKGVLYFGNGYGLYRAVNSTVEKITPNDPHIIAMEVFRDKLIITGSSIQIDGKSYTTVSFDGSGFAPISDIHSGYSILVCNNQLFLGNYPVLTYDDGELTYIDIEGQTNMTNDDEGNIYIASIIADAQGNTQSLVQKYAKGESSTLGGPLNCHIHSIQSFNNTIVVAGFADPNTAVSYYYKNGDWISLEGANGVREMIVYDNKLIGVPLSSRRAVELN